MSDPVLALGWLAILAAAIAGIVLLRAAGLASTYTRDLLHVGTGIWIFGWPFWDAPWLPIAITVGAAIAIWLVPRVGHRSSLIARVERSVTGGDEHWGGLVLYTLAYATFTTVGLLGDPFPAAAALLALSLGDGIGGAIGRHVGRHHFQAPGGKTKSLEGSLVVGLGALAGIAIAALLFADRIDLPGALAVAVVAATVEALSPRGTDNLLLPLAAWGTVLLVT